jgi:hypothetical protein
MFVEKERDDALDSLFRGRPEQNSTFYSSGKNGGASSAAASASAASAAASSSSFSTLNPNLTFNSLKYHKV